MGWRRFPQVRLNLRWWKDFSSGVWFRLHFPFFFSAGNDVFLSPHRDQFFTLHLSPFETSPFFPSFHTGGISFFAPDLPFFFSFSDPPPFSPPESWRNFLFFAPPKGSSFFLLMEKLALFFSSVSMGCAFFLSFVGCDPSLLGERVVSSLQQAPVKTGFFHPSPI